MRTRALKTLSEINRVGSFATAANRLNMTLSAVSMQMKTLEEDLGAKLFDRTFRPPRLTPLGRTIAAEAVRLLAAERDLRAACAPTDSLVGRYRIGFIPTASVRLLPAFLQRAADDAPAAAFEVVTGLTDTLEAMVRRGELDFAVTTGFSRADPALHVEVLAEERLSFAAPMQPASSDPAALIHDLAFLLFTPSSGIGTVIAARMEPHLSQGRGHMVLDSVEAIMECVNVGIGFTLLPEPDIVRYAGPSTRTFCGEGLSRRVVLISATAHGAVAQAMQVADLFPR